MFPTGILRIIIIIISSGKRMINGRSSKVMESSRLVLRIQKLSDNRFHKRILRQRHLQSGQTISPHTISQCHSRAVFKKVLPVSLYFPGRKMISHSGTVTSDVISQNIYLVALRSATVSVAWKENTEKVFPTVRCTQYRPVRIIAIASKLSCHLDTQFHRNR